MLKKNVLGLLIIITGFSSCEKNINFKLNQTPSQLVVDASIENDKAPIVFLSTSLNYFSKISPAILESSFVHNATISISNGTKTQQLKEYATPADSSGNIVYYYTIDSTNVTTIFYGDFNTAYTLTIQADGKEYTASTHITSIAKKIDSLWWLPAPGSIDSTEIVLMAEITDPPGYGNYIRYYTSVNRSSFFPGLNSVFDDQITDGTTYSIEIPKGVNRNQAIDMNKYSFFNYGDTTTIKFCNIDKPTYDFWRTMEYNYQSIGNPFSTPTQVLGNISNGALGYFGGYAAQYTSLIIPKK
jgi:hypothetical protein